MTIHPYPPAAEGPDRRTPAQIEQDIAARRAHLAATVDEITDKVNPVNVAKRTSSRVLDAARSVTRSTGRLAAVGAGAAGLLAAWAFRRRRR